MLLLGGFAIAAALSKHALAKRGATWILARVGQRPSVVLLTNMLVQALLESDIAMLDMYALVEWSSCIPALHCAPR